MADDWDIEDTTTSAPSAKLFGKWSVVCDLIACKINLDLRRNA